MKQINIAVVIIIICGFCITLYFKCHIYTDLEIMPGKGIIIDNDSVMLTNTSMSQLFKELKVDTFSEIYKVEVETFGKGDDFHSSYFEKAIGKRNLLFKFQGADSIHLVLNEIEVSHQNKSKVRLHKSSIPDYFYCEQLINLNGGKSNSLYLSGDSCIVSFSNQGVTYELIKKRRKYRIKKIEIYKSNRFIPNK